ncbi:hypothetical protein [Thermaerobacillus caldiproteolyticus]|uniref:hypothetical protein n=1 Tax=Thermaerobacillus caldiproteolyticus TaxID=247480 RepID=UPI00188C0461|nr:hypothetical protein [Anoxybacillus caldiproteolyticus]QPA32386.1 hypothetical protein ISX45_05300 [Anoxybacillus caldiproteolyticus]
MEFQENTVKRNSRYRGGFAAEKRFLATNKYDALLFERQDNFGWLTSGGHNGIFYNSELGECALLVTDEDIKIAMINYTYQSLYSRT